MITLIQCKDPKTKEMCNGKGTCKCGKCDCNSHSEGGYINGDTDDGDDDNDDNDDDDGDEEKGETRQMDNLFFISQESSVKRRKVSPSPIYRGTLATSSPLASLTMFMMMIMFMNMNPIIMLMFMNMEMRRCS